MALNIQPGKVEVDFLPWYQPNVAMLRCEGRTGCGALVMSDDAERHVRHHQDVLDVLVALAMAARL